MSKRPTLVEAFEAARIIEAAENYAIADLVDKTSSGAHVLPVLTFWSEGEFWRYVLGDRDNFNELPVNLPEVVVSEWVPRVPGLYWDPKARQMRFDTTDGRLIYDPYSKSQFVLGGIGTLRLSPDSNGQRIFSVSTGGNVSAAIPVIIPNRIWRRLGLNTGTTVALKEVWWQTMAENWTQRFDSVNVPRAYLCIEDESQIQVIGRSTEPTYQPFSVIVYVKGYAEFYDYVFCNVRANESQDQLADFFEMYRIQYGYGGQYLLNPDPALPLFNSVFNSPEQLRQADAGGRYHLDMLRDGVRQAYFRGLTVEYILEVLSRNYITTASIDRIATYLKYPIVMFDNNNATDRISQLVKWCIDFRDSNQYKNGGKMEELIDKLVTEQLIS
jgi:hypothetical protein